MKELNLLWCEKYLGATISEKSLGCNTRQDRPWGIQVIMCANSSFARICWSLAGNVDDALGPRRRLTQWVSMELLLLFVVGAVSVLGTANAGFTLVPVIVVTALQLTLIGEFRELR